MRYVVLLVVVGGCGDPTVKVAEDFAYPSDFSPPADFAIERTAFDMVDTRDMVAPPDLYGADLSCVDFFVGTMTMCLACGDVGQPCCPAATGSSPTCNDGAQCEGANRCSNSNPGDQRTAGCFNCDVQGCGLAGHPCCIHEPDGFLCLQQGLSCKAGVCQ